MKKDFIKKDVIKKDTAKSHYGTRDYAKKDDTKKASVKKDFGKKEYGKKTYTKKDGGKADAAKKSEEPKKRDYGKRTFVKRDTEMKEREVWNAGNMLYPAPVVLVSVADASGKTNILTVAWTGTICSDPAMLYISVRPERYSYQMIKESKEFVVNLTTKDLAQATDYCGVRSGKDVDKWKEAHLTAGKAQEVSAPIIMESPVNIECKVVEVKELGSHHMFIAKVVAVDVDPTYLNSKGKLELNRTELIAYSHGEYLETGKSIGTFGYSVKRGAASKWAATKKRR